MKRSKSEQFFSGINLAVCVLIGLCCLIPFLHIIALSFSGQQVILTHQVTLWPRDFQALSYRLIFSDGRMMNSMRFTILLTVLGTCVSMIFTIFTAYPLSKKYLAGRSFILFFITFTMLFSGGMIPLYLVVKECGLLNKIWALILPVSIGAYNVLIMKTYFSSTIPESIEESARIDGCNSLRMLFYIIIPMSVPMIATISLFYAVGYWNNFFTCMLYMTDPDKVTLQLRLRQLLIVDESLQIFDFDENAKLGSEAVKSATIMVATIPILLVYPWLQKYFVKGIMLGSIKG